jgi:hypothetical protein
MIFADRGTTVWDGTLTGVAPQWTATYGQYDNGASVFNNYYNFAGTILDNRISTISGVKLTQNNSLSIAVTITETTFYILTSSFETSPFVMEAYETYYGVPASANVNEQWGLIIDSNTSTSQNTGGSHGGTLYIGIIPNAGAGSWGPHIVMGQTDLGGLGYNFSSQYTAIDSITQSPSSVSISFNGITYSTSTNALTSGYIGFYVYSDTANSIISTVHWLRTRAYPPNGVMPSVELI